MRTTPLVCPAVRGITCIKLKLPPSWPAIGSSAETILTRILEWVLVASLQRYPGQQARLIQRILDQILVPESALKPGPSGWTDPTTYVSEATE
jgi:hypothetical protein